MQKKIPGIVLALLLAGSVQATVQSDREGFPGHTREYGVSPNHQRFLWKHLFAPVEVMPAFKPFINDDGNKIDNDFQIYNRHSIGYHCKLFKDRYLFQPSVAVTHRRYQSTGDQWSKFVFGEPGFHFE